MEQRWQSANVTHLMDPNALPWMPKKCRRSPWGNRDSLNQQDGAMSYASGQHKHARTALCETTIIRANDHMRKPRGQACYSSRNAKGLEQGWVKSRLVQDQFHKLLFDEKGVGILQSQICLHSTRNSTSLSEIFNVLVMKRWGILWAGYFEMSPNSYSFINLSSQQSTCQPSITQVIMSVIGPHR